MKFPANTANAVIATVGTVAPWWASAHDAANKWIATGVALLSLVHFGRQIYLSFKSKK